MDNFVDRLLGGKHHEEIRRTPACSGTSSLHLYQISPAALFHVKHYQAPVRRPFDTESDANSWISGNIPCPTWAPISSVLLVSG